MGRTQVMASIKHFLKITNIYGNKYLESLCPISSFLDTKNSKE